MRGEVEVLCDFCRVEKGALTDNTLFMHEGANCISLHLLATDVIFKSSFNCFCSNSMEVTQENEVLFLFSVAAERSRAILDHIFYNSELFTIAVISGSSE